MNGSDRYLVEMFVEEKAKPAACVCMPFGVPRQKTHTSEVELNVSNALTSPCVAVHCGGRWPGCDMVSYGTAGNRVIRVVVGIVLGLALHCPDERSLGHKPSD